MWRRPGTCHGQVCAQPDQFQRREQFNTDLRRACPARGWPNLRAVREPLAEHLLQLLAPLGRGPRLSTCRHWLFADLELKAGQLSYQCREIALQGQFGEANVQSQISTQLQGLHLFQLPAEQHLQQKQGQHPKGHQGHPPGTKASQTSSQRPLARHLSGISACRPTQK